MNCAWVEIPGRIVHGHRVASGLADHQPYGKGTLVLQKPIFAALGLDLSNTHDGTLNVSIRPYRYTGAHPDHRFRQVEWTPFHPPENFSFSRCVVIVGELRHNGWIYSPDPETKKAQFQDRCTVEIIASFISGVRYGDAVIVSLSPSNLARDEHSTETTS